jgi:hypothetical protein
MLAEKFFLVLETLRSNAPSDMVVVSAEHHIPVKLPRSHSYLLFHHRSLDGLPATSVNASPR